MAGAWNELTWGIGNYGEQNNATVSVSGVSASSGIGSSTAEGTVDFGWGRKEWGEFVWGGRGSLITEGISATITAEPLSILGFTALANAQISTDQSKFGGSSLELDGSNDRIQSGDITLGTDSYTWETFAYFNSFSSTQCIWDAGENVGGSKNPVVYITATNIQISYAGGTYINVAHGMSTDTWHHIAIVRDGTGLGNLKAYIDGTNVGTGNLGLVGAGATNHVLGGNFAGTFTMDGYLDESRLTRRVIYTENFTPPSAPFTADDADIWLLHYDGTNGSQTIVNSAQIPDSPVTITGNANITVTGISATSTTGDAALRVDADVDATGSSATTSIGSAVLTVNADVSVSGIGLTTAMGTEEAYNTTGWGRLFWGSADWGEGADETVTVTGQELTSAIGEETAFTDVTIAVSGIELRSITGNEDAFTDVTVEVTGQSLTSSIGDESVAVDVTVEASGIGLTITLLSVEAGLITPVDVTGVSLSTNIGQVITFDSLAKPEGISLTTGITSVKITGWNEVDTGTPVTWSDVDLAA